MVSKAKKENAGKKKKIKVLNLNKETVKNLTDNETKDVKGGAISLSLVGGGGRSFVRATSTLDATR
jgi:natural product precursor